MRTVAPVSVVTELKKIFAQIFNVFFLIYMYIYGQKWPLKLPVTWFRNMTVSLNQLTCLEIFCHKSDGSVKILFFCDARFDFE